MSKRVSNAKGKRSQHRGYRLRMHRERGAATYRSKYLAAGALTTWLRNLFAASPREQQPR